MTSLSHIAAWGPQHLATKVAVCTLLTTVYKAACLHASASYALQHAWMAQHKRYTVSARHLLARSDGVCTHIAISALHSGQLGLAARHIDMCFRLESVIPSPMSHSWLPTPDFKDINEMKMKMNIQHPGGY